MGCNNAMWLKTVMVSVVYRSAMNAHGRLLLVAPMYWANGNRRQTTFSLH